MRMRVKSLMVVPCAMTIAVIVSACSAGIEGVAPSARAPLDTTLMQSAGRGAGAGDSNHGLMIEHFAPVAVAAPVNTQTAMLSIPDQHQPLPRVEPATPAAAQRKARRQANSFVALAYHRVGYDKSPYTVTPEAFRQQMQFLYEQGYAVITLSQVDAFLQGYAVLPDKAVLLTIDDGHRSSYTEIYPALREFGFSALYLPYSEYINNGGLTSRQILEMDASGLAEFALHTHTHSALTLPLDGETHSAYENRVLHELSQPREQLEALLGQSMRTLAYPYGRVNRYVVSKAKQVGMKMGFTVNCARNYSGTDPLLLNRCTLVAADDLAGFRYKLENASPVVPSTIVAKHRTRRGGQQQSAQRNAAAGNSAGSEGVITNTETAPEFLGHIAGREFFAGVPIQPFSGYFVDPHGSQLNFAAIGLPRGLQIDARTGIVSGTPTTASSLNGVRIVAKNNQGISAPSNTFSVTVY